MQDELDTAAVLDAEGEYDAILPTGYTEDADFFDRGTWGGNGDGSAAEAGTETGADNSAGEVTGQTAPAIEPEADTGTTGDNGTAEGAPAIEPTEVTPAVSKKKVTYQFNHENVEQEYDDADLPEVFQKARSVDRYKERVAHMQTTLDRAGQTAKSLGYKDADEMLEKLHETAQNSIRESLLDKGVPEELVDDYVARRFPATVSPQSDATAFGTNSAPAQSVENGRDFQGEARAFLQQNPDLIGKQLPSEVVSKWSSGMSLTEAYKDYQLKSEMAKSAQLSKELAIEKQNAAAAAKAPVTGVTRGGSAKQVPESDFLRGFNSDDW